MFAAGGVGCVQPGLCSLANAAASGKLLVCSWGAGNHHSLEGGAPDKQREGWGARLGVVPVGSVLNCDVLGLSP